MTRRRIAAISVVVLLAAAAALAIELTRGGGSTRLSWKPTEGSKPIRTVAVSADTGQFFFAVNAVPAGHNTLRYVDSDGWAIVYPRAFHAVAFSSSTGTALSEDGTNFANFTPVPAPGTPPPIPSDGVLLGITSEWGSVTGGARLGQDSRFPLRLPGTFRTHGTGWMRRTDFDFQGNGVAYHVSIVAGPEASRADLEAIQRMVASIGFPPARGSGQAVRPSTS